MTETGKRDFDKESETWDENPARTELARAISGAILRRVSITKSMDALDYGAGTGLVTLALQPHVRSLVAADSSEGMLAKLSEKVTVSGLSNVQTVLLDLENDPAPEWRFDLIVSSMTFHHIQSIPALVLRLSEMLRTGGYIAVADLDLDDGEFHADSTGVKHDGLDRDEMKRIFAASGLDEVTVDTAHTMAREVPGKGQREFSIFLIAGKKS